MDAELRINAYEVSQSQDNIHILQMPQWWGVRVGQECVWRSERLGRVEEEGHNTVHSFALGDSNGDESKYSWRSMKKEETYFWFALRRDEMLTLPLILSDLTF